MPPDLYPKLPNSLEAEQGLLGSMLLDPQGVIPDCVERINEKAFYLPAHARIYALLVELWTNNTPADFIILTQALRDRDLLDSVGGPAFITHLFTFTPTSANAGYYLDIVSGKARLRTIHATASAVAAAACQEGADPAELSEQLQQLLTTLARQASTGSSVAQVSDMIPAAVQRLEDRHKGKGQLRGIASGIGKLDQLTGGWQPGQMIVVAAREKEGKSSLARQFILEAAICREVPVAVFSHEMGREEIVDALITSRSRVDSRRIEDGTLLEDDFLKIMRAAVALQGTTIYIFDEADSSVLQFRANARRAVLEFGCRLIVLDYLQLVNGTGDEDRREQEVAAVSRNAKLAAKELGVPIIVLSQLNSKGATRESMAVQQDLDKLIVIEHEDPETEGDGKAWLRLKLHRGGPKGSVPVMWRPAITRFDPLAPEDEAQS